MQESGYVGEASRSEKTTGKYVLIAVLCGSGFTSLLILLLWLPFPPLSVVSALLLAPGGIVASVLTRSESFGPPSLVLVVNSLLYSVVVYVSMSVLGKEIPATKIRFALAKLSIPVIILLALVCIPALDPLSPHGMVELGEQEDLFRPLFRWAWGWKQLAPNCVQRESHLPTGAKRLAECCRRDGTVTSARLRGGASNFDSP